MKGGQERTCELILHLVLKYFKHVRLFWEAINSLTQEETQIKNGFGNGKFHEFGMEDKKDSLSIIADSSTIPD